MENLAYPDGICFSRKGAMLSVGPLTSYGSQENAFGIGRLLNRYSLTERNEAGSGKDFMWLVFPADPNRPFRMTCTAVVLRVVREDAELEICFPDPHQLRIRSKNLPLAIRGRTEAHEALVDRLDGTWQLGLFDSLGEFLFVPLAGSCRSESRWIWTRPGSDRLDLRVVPGEDRIAELCICYGDSNVERPASCPPFRDLISGLEKEYREWCGSFPENRSVPAQIRDRAVFTCWNNLAGGMGRLTRELLFSRPREKADMPASLLLLALRGFPPPDCHDPFSVYAYQSPDGQLPCLADDKYTEYRCACPPVEGWIARLFRDCGAERISDGFRASEASLSGWLGWWKDRRCTSGEALPYAAAAEELLGMDSMTGAFRYPLCSPVLTTFLILLADLTAIISEKPEARKQSLDLAERWTELLTDELWKNGEFHSRNPVTGELLPVGSTTGRYLPLLLSDRLPPAVGEILKSEILKDFAADPEPEYILFRIHLLLKLGYRNEAGNMIRGWLKESAGSIADGSADSRTCVTHLLLAAIADMPVMKDPESKEE